MVAVTSIAGNYLEALGTRLISGRNVILNGETAVVVSNEFAHAFFGDQNPIGQWVRVSGSSMEVVGVVQRLVTLDEGRKPVLELYRPYEPLKAAGSGTLAFPFGSHV